MDDVAASSAVETFATRRSVLEPETVWRLRADALVREQTSALPASFWGSFMRMGWRILFPWSAPLTSDQWPERVPYDQIKSIRVRFDPTRVDRVRERCDLVGPNGQKISLFSTRYIGIGTFEDQAATYRPFISELIQRVVASQPATPVYSGLDWRSYVLQHGILLVALLALVTALGIAGIPALGTIWAKALIVLSYTGLLCAYAQRNWPRKLNLTDFEARPPVTPPNNKRG